LETLLVKIAKNAPVPVYNFLRILPKQNNITH
jgi:hypothetical protein